MPCGAACTQPSGPFTFGRRRFASAWRFTTSSKRRDRRSVRPRFGLRLRRDQKTIRPWFSGLSGPLSGLCSPPRALRASAPQYCSFAAGARASWFEVHRRGAPPARLVGVDGMYRGRALPRVRPRRACSLVGGVAGRKTKKARPRPSFFGQVERETGFEPATSTLARLHSTTELFPHRSSVFASAAPR